MSAMTTQQIRAAEDIISKHKDHHGIFDWEFSITDNDGNLSYLFGGSESESYKELKLIRVELLRLGIIAGVDYENIRTRLTAKGLAFKNLTSELKKKKGDGWMKNFKAWVKK